jgi:hypothetical protein
MPVVIYHLPAHLRLVFPTSGSTLAWPPDSLISKTRKCQRRDLATPSRPHRSTSGRSVIHVVQVTYLPEQATQKVKGQLGRETGQPTQLRFAAAASFGRGSELGMGSVMRVVAC